MSNALKQQDIEKVAVTTATSFALPTKHAKNGALRARFGVGSNSLVERLTSGLLFLSGALTIGITFAIVYFLFSELGDFFYQVSIFDFLFGTEWSPLIGEEKKYGVLALVSGTLRIAVGSCLVAIPIGLATALFLSEYAGPKLRATAKSTLEVLAGIPTVVYGYLAISLVTPQLQVIFPDINFYNAFSASIVVGLMVIPTIASISQDAFEAVSRELRDAAYGLGARKFQVALGIVFPAAFSGVVASIILAFSRALGETMAVNIAAGRSPQFSFNFLESCQTMTSFIAEVTSGETPAGSTVYKAMFAVGLLLFFMTLVTNLIAQYFVRRIHETDS